MGRVETRKDVPRLAVVQVKDNGAWSLELTQREVGSFWIIPKVEQKNFLMRERRKETRKVSSQLLA